MIDANVVAEAREEANANPVVTECRSLSVAVGTILTLMCCYFYQKPEAHSNGQGFDTIDKKYSYIGVYYLLSLMNLHTMAFRHWIRNASVKPPWLISLVRFRSFS